MGTFRVLCLHGFGQDALKFRNRISSLRRALKSSFDFVFPEAPFLVTSFPNSTPEEQAKIAEAEPTYKWWDFEIDEESGKHTYGRVDEADYLAEFVRKEGPFDGIFGFSQGGMTANLLLQRQCADPNNSPFSFKFALFFASCDLGDPVPSIHFMGETDAIVSMAEAKNCSSYITTQSMSLFQADATDVTSFFVSSVAAMNKFRVLCLHGYRQDALKLRGRIAALRRTFKSSVEFVCLDAPFEVPYEPTAEEHANNGETGENVKQLKWCDFTRDEETGQYLLSRVEEAIEYIANFVTKEGPFDGIFGFSQGGSMASMILQRQVSTSESPFAFRFSIFVSAGAIGDPKYMSDVKVDMPSLHVIGETDAVVDNERSLALKDIFVNPTVFMHPGGHYIPTNKEPKDAFRAFFKELQEADEAQ
ncbi:Serine hydrolase (FSH1) [Phytophthora infestans]|nr:Serine hydrolase (FSH1) [Phytophthora infestans]